LTSAPKLGEWSRCCGALVTSSNSLPRRRGRPAKVIKYHKTKDRYFVRFSGQYVYGATEEEVLDKYNRLRAKHEIPKVGLFCHGFQAGILEAVLFGG
jgi:hypothetical protein